MSSPSMIKVDNGGNGADFSCLNDHYTKNVDNFIMCCFHPVWSLLEGLTFSPYSWQGGGTKNLHFTFSSNYYRMAAINDYFKSW